MAAFATPDQVEAIFRPLTSAEAIVADARLAEASDHIRSEVPTVDARIAAGTLSASLVAGVAAAMVRRVLLNPTVARQKSRSIDDYQETDTLDSSISTGEIYLTPREFRLLTGSRRRSRAFTIVPAGRFPSVL